MIVSPNIEHYRQHSIRMNACAQGIDDKLGNGDENATHTLITNA